MDARKKVFAVISMIVALIYIASSIKGQNQAEEKKILFQDEIRATKFTLVDKSGRATMEMGLNDSNGMIRISFFDKNNVERILFGLANGASPVLWMYGKDGSDKLIIGLQDGERPMIEFKDQNNDTRIHMYLNQNGEPYSERIHYAKPKDQKF